MADVVVDAVGVTAAVTADSAPANMLRVGSDTVDAPAATVAGLDVVDAAAFTGADATSDATELLDAAGVVDGVVEVVDGGPDTADSTGAVGAAGSCSER